MRHWPLILALMAAAVTPAFAEPTTITVRAHSRDAKFIGTGMGGVLVRLVDAGSGAVLAEGLTAGGTGDTARLMTEPHLRGAPLAGEGDAAFAAVIDIDRPTLVRLEATGPKGHPGAEITVTSMAWVLPGQPVVGDGWVVEFPGLVVTPRVTQKAGPGLRVTATVTLMCGCPVTPGGLWNADHFKVIALLSDDAGKALSVPMTYAGAASTFEADLPEPGKGAWQVTVTAIDERSGNVGVGTTGKEGPRGAP